MYGLLHASGVATFGYAVYYQFFRLHVPRSVIRSPAVVAMGKFPGKWKYLTVWDLVMQFAYHSYSLANDIYGSSEVVAKNQTKMQRFRDVVFASWIFPTGTFVSITFWGLYAIDRELVFPKSMDAFYPTWLNHAVHTAPIIFLCVEIYNIPRLFPKRSTSVAGNLFFSSCYLGWITWIAYDSGVWAYPILEVLNNTARTVFLGGCAAMLLGMYFVGEKIQRWRWGNKSVEGCVDSSEDGSTATEGTQTRNEPTSSSSTRRKLK